MTERVRGTRDFFPEKMRVRNWLFKMFHNAALSHGFEEYDAPVLETEELYIRKSGEEITQQLYNFEDKGGRKVALRPEMTPSLARMVKSVSGTLALPIKWYSIPQCWRYERTQRGRGREHYQWNVDIWGASGVEAEVELLSVLVHFFREAGITHEDVQIHVSSRGIMEAILRQQDFGELYIPEACVIIDKIGKGGEIPRSFEKIPTGLRDQLVDIGIYSEQWAELSRFFDQSDWFDSYEEWEEAIEAKENNLEYDGIIDTELWDSLKDDPAYNEFIEFYRLLDGYNLREWVCTDFTIVRGLSYYTGIVFEVIDTRRKFRSICGGGRYDRLIGTLGGQDIPAVGFGFGDMVIMELLQDIEDSEYEDEIKDQKIEYMVFGLGPEMRGHAMKVAGDLRSKGRSVDIILEDKKMKWAFKHASRIGAKEIVLVMPEEWENDQTLLVRVPGEGVDAQYSITLADLLVNTEKSLDENQ